MTEKAVPYFAVFLVIMLSCFVGYKLGIKLALFIAPLMYPQITEIDDWKQKMLAGPRKR